MNKSNPDKKSYKSVYKPLNPKKYTGKRPIIMRSTWERQFAKWLDSNSNVEWWQSESTIIPYISKVDGRQRRYFVDFTVKFTNGRTVLFEIKPERQTRIPKIPERKTKKFLREVNTYGTNISKWEAAQAYAQSRNMSFQILTERELKKLGIKII